MKRSRRIPILAALTATALLPLLPLLLALPASAAGACPQGATLVLPAHEDDDLLFMSPDLLRDVQAGRCVRTVFLTAGDANRGEAYWQSRERGAKAAYAQMAGVADSWSISDLGIAGHPVQLATLTARPAISLAFLRLPDGFPSGGGGSASGYQSLQKLWEGTISTIRAVDGSSSYSRSDLISTLTGLMGDLAPDRVLAHDYSSPFGSGDHSDHLAGGKLVHSAHRGYTSPHVLRAYEGYGVRSKPANVSGADLAGKQAAFYAYARYDDGVCGSTAACAGTEYESYLQRQYLSGSETIGAPSEPQTSNVARSAAVEASSENTGTTQTALKAVDGVISGWPADHTKEWATVGGGAGSWLRLTWTSPQTVSRVVLYDRPNSDDAVTASALRFSDGSTVASGALANDGSAVTVTFTGRTVTSLQLDIAGVSSTTQNIGLAEIEVFAAATSSPAPTTSASPTSSASPTPTQSAPPPASATPSPSAEAGTPKNVARNASTAASSQNKKTGQTANRAVDGVASGAPADPRREWATVGGGAGSWLRLSWQSPQRIGRVVLYDRPNLRDRITSAVLALGDGTSVLTEPLPDDGSPLTVTFPPRPLSSLELRITGVSASTTDIGLSELEAFAA